MVDDRASTRRGIALLESFKDGKSAIRWVRRNAERLCVDRDGIVASDRSAAGLIAACCGVISNSDVPAEDTSISNVASVMVLFTTSLGYLSGESTVE